MIELLMVIVIVAALGSAAVTQFLDFRTEGKKAAVASMLNTIREGIKNQKNQAFLRCEMTNYLWTNYTGGGSSHSLHILLNANDITHDYTGTGAYMCTPSQIVNEADRKFVDQPTLPTNIFNSGSLVGSCNTGAKGCAGLDSFRAIGATGAGVPLGYGWCYNPTRDEFIAISNEAGECDL